MIWQYQLKRTRVSARALRHRLQSLGKRKQGDAKLVIMVHPGRAGSSVLGSMLHQHSLLRWDCEIFSRMPTHSVSLDEAGHVLWRDHIESCLQRCPKPNLGIEIKIHQIIRKKIFGRDIEESLTQLSEAFDFDLVLLTRRNHLARWLSGAVARENSKFNYREGEVAPKIQLPLPAEVKDHAYGLGKMDVNAWLDEVARINDAFVAAVTRRKGLILTYEDDVLGDPGQGYRRILDFIGLSAEKSEPLFIKADRRPLSARLSNFEELAKLLGPEHHARYCCADRAPHGPSG